MSLRTYTELIQIHSFEERLRYLMLKNNVGVETFGFDRYLNQMFYHSVEWERIKRDVIIRDNGCDLACKDREIHGRIYVHHMNPISKQDILKRTEILLNPEYLVCVCKQTHDAIHYGNESVLAQNQLVERRPNDTCPWKH